MINEKQLLSELEDKDYRLQLDAMTKSSDKQVLTTAGEIRTESKPGDDGNSDEVGSMTMPPALAELVMSAALNKQVLTPVKQPVYVGESPVAPNAPQKKGEAETTAPAATAPAATGAIRLPLSCVEAWDASRQSGKKRAHDHV